MGHLADPRSRLMLPRRGLVAGAAALVAMAALPKDARAWKHGTSTSTFPASVTSLGLQSVYTQWPDGGPIASTVGLSGPLLWTPTAPNGSLPAGWSISGGNVLNINGDATVSDYDFSGYQLLFHGTTSRTCHFSNCRILMNSNVVGDQIVTVANVLYIYLITWDHCEFSSSFGAGVHTSTTPGLIALNGTITGSYWKNCNFIQSANGFIFNAGDSLVQNCTFGFPGLNTSSISVHYDVIFNNGDYTQGGGITVDQCVFDFAPIGGQTSPFTGPITLFAQSNGTPKSGVTSCTLTTTNSIYRGYPAYAAVCNGGAGGITGGPMETSNGGSGAQTAAGTVTNCCIEKDVFGVYYQTGSGTTITHSGNRDYVSNAAV